MLNFPGRISDGSQDEFSESTEAPRSLYISFLNPYGCGGNFGFLFAGRVAGDTASVAFRRAEIVSQVKIGKKSFWMI